MTLRVRTQDDNVGRRSIPIPHLIVSATTSGAANTLLTVRPKVSLIVRQLSVVNVTGSAATLSVNSVPAAGSIADANAEFVAYSVAANTAVDLTSLIGQFYVAGTVLRAYSGTANALVLHGWAEEVL